MNPQVVFPACLLLFWTLTGSNANSKITVKTVLDGIKLTCEDKTYLLEDTNENYLVLQYVDSSSGHYKCINNGSQEESTITVKFRTCDNCIDLDVASIAGIVVGDVVATMVIGVVVYLVASGTGPATTTRTSPTKVTGRQLHVPNDVSNRANNDHYQDLRFNKGGQKDTYDVIRNRK